MNITRNGTTITLTADELRRAYYEQQHLFDMEDIEAQCEELEAEGRIAYRRMTEIISRPNLLSKVADDMRRKVDKYDMDWRCAAREAITAVEISSDK